MRESTHFLSIEETSLCECEFKDRSVTSMSHILRLDCSLSPSTVQQLPNNDNQVEIFLKPLVKCLKIIGCPLIGLGQPMSLKTERFFRFTGWLLFVVNVSLNIHHIYQIYRVFLQEGLLNSSTFSGSFLMSFIVSVMTRILSHLILLILSGSSSQIQLVETIRNLSSFPGLKLRQNISRVSTHLCLLVRN